MKFLVDENLSERVAELLVENGHDALHVRAIGLATADDHVVMARAEVEERVIVSADTDFGALLFRSGKRAPSVILLRLAGQRRAWSRAALILANLPQGGRSRRGRHGGHRGGPRAEPSAPVDSRLTHEMPRGCPAEGPEMPGCRGQ